MLVALAYNWFIINTQAQLWNNIESGGVGIFGRSRDNERSQPRVHESYDIVDVADSGLRGPPAKNCTGSGCCIPKCFAEKGNRGLPGVPGFQGIKGM